MAAETEEWALKLLDMASGNALKIASSLGNLDSQQLKAASSAMAFQSAQTALAKAEASGNIAARDAALASMKKLQLSEAMKAAAAQEKAQAAAKKASDKDAADAAKAQARADADAAKAQKAAAKDAAKDASDAAKKQAKAAADQAKAQKDSAKEAADAQSEAVAALKAPIDTATSALEKMGPKGAAAAMAIKAAFAVAAIVITATIGTLYKMAEAAIEVTAQRARLLATFSALSFGAAGGAKTLAIVEKLGVSLPFATAQIAEWATGLQKAGFQGQALKNALQAIGAAEALIQGGGAAAQSLFETLGKGGAAALSLVATLKRGGPEARSQLADMGLRVQDVAAALGMTVAQFQRANLSAKQMAEAIQKALAKKAAGPLADLFLTFPVLIQKVREGVMSLFDKMGPAVRPFMQAVKELFGQFSKGGGAINALKPIVTAVLTTLFSWATKGVQAISALVKSFTSAGKSAGVLSGAAAILKAGWAALVAIFKAIWTSLAPVVAIFKAIFSNALVLQGIKAIFTVIAAVVMAVVVAFGLFFGVLASIAAAVAAGVGALTGLVASVAGLGAEIVSGLVGGLDVGAFVEKMAGMAQAGLAAFKAALGISSPSKVMMEMGGHTATGFAEGVDDGADKVQGAMDKMVTPKAGKGGAGKGKAPIAEHVHFHYAGPAEDADPFFEKAAAWLRQMRDEAPEPEPA